MTTVYWELLHRRKQAVSADDAVASYIAGTLPESGDATCDHHDHEGHGDHDCGHGGCHH